MKRLFLSLTFILALSFIGCVVAKETAGNYEIATKDGQTVTFKNKTGKYRILKGGENLKVGSVITILPTDDRNKVSIVRLK